ncbi:MAG: (2Fe-2S)-binding protein, partial [Aestuariibacter sp.]|nr:(2Fe-2S)-binding protein [Aestuariibacter sp.]
YFLRNQLGLTGLKVGCGEGECGACTVLLDDEPVNACLVLAFQAAGRRITTIEGLTGPDGTLSALQKSFIEHGAVQCGYCSAGMVLASEGLLRRNPSPDDSEIRNALAGNICRCTGFLSIIEAVKALACR